MASLTKTSENEQTSASLNENTLQTNQLVTNQDVVIDIPENTLISGDEKTSLSSSSSTSTTVETNKEKKEETKEENEKEKKEKPQQKPKIEITPINFQTFLEFIQNYQTKFLSKPQQEQSESTTDIQITKEENIFLNSQKQYWMAFSMLIIKLVLYFFILFYFIKSYIFVFFLVKIQRKAIKNC